MSGAWKPPLISVCFVLHHLSFRGHHKLIGVYVLVWQFSTGWALAQDDLRIKAWSQQLAEKLHAINVQKGIASEFVYMGDAGEWQNPYAGFPNENVARMREIRSSYDPHGIFSRLNWGGFKLGL